MLLSFPFFDAVFVAWEELRNAFSVDAEPCRIWSGNRDRTDRTKTVSHLPNKNYLENIKITMVPRGGVDAPKQKRRKVPKNESAENVYYWIIIFLICCELTLTEYKT